MWRSITCEVSEESIMIFIMKNMYLNICSLDCNSQFSTHLPPPTHTHKYHFLYHPIYLIPLSLFLFFSCVQILMLTFPLILYVPMYVYLSLLFFDIARLSSTLNGFFFACYVLSLSLSLYIYIYLSLSFFLFLYFSLSLHLSLILSVSLCLSSPTSLPLSLFFSFFIPPVLCVLQY